MCTAFYRIDIIDVGMEVLAVRSVVHDGHFNGDASLLRIEIDDVIEEVDTRGIDVAHKFAQTVFGMEHFLTDIAFVVLALVGQRDGDTCIEVGQFAHAVGKDVIFISGGRKDGVIWPEMLTRTAQFGLSHHLNGVEGMSLCVFLLINLSIAEHLRLHVFRQRVDAADTDAVQTARDLVGAFVELSSSVKYGHYDFEC